MDEQVTVVAGIVIPSVSPVFLTSVAFHVGIALMSVVAGVIAMLSLKGPGRHTRFGKLYFWSLAGVFASASALSFLRWAENYHLFIIGASAFATALVARTAVRNRWPAWPRLHLIGMGASYVLLLIAFYVDNGKNLPLWRDLPSASYWFIPAAIGVPLIFACCFIIRSRGRAEAQRRLRVDVSGQLRCMSDNTVNAARRRLGYSKDSLSASAGAGLS